MAGELALAQKLLDELLILRPDAARIRCDLAYLHQQQGRLDQADQAFQQAIAAAPRDGYIRRMYGGLLMRQQRWADAADQLTIAVTERPDDLDAWYNLAVSAAMQGQFAESRAHLERALAIDPHHASALHAMGAAFMQEGDYAQAAQYFRQALTVDPDHPRARQDLARAEQHLSD